MIDVLVAVVADGRAIATSRVPSRIEVLSSDDDESSRSFSFSGYPIQSGYEIRGDLKIEVTLVEGENSIFQVECKGTRVATLQIEGGRFGMVKGERGWSIYERSVDFSSSQLQLKGVTFNVS